jgi:predicted ribosomally synthesized peptide with nif11-like leader
MAKKEAQRFVEAARTSEPIRAQLAQATTADDIVSVGTENGFHFTAEEFEQVRDELAADLQLAAGELVDAHLEQVTGGVSTVISAVAGQGSAEDDYGRVKVQFNWDRS